jgi:hypothetical protein
VFPREEWSAHWADISDTLAVGDFDTFFWFTVKGPTNPDLDSDSCDGAGWGVDVVAHFESEIEPLATVFDEVRIEVLEADANGIIWDSISVNCGREARWGHRGLGEDLPRQSLIKLRSSKIHLRDKDKKANG